MISPGKQRFPPAGKPGKTWWNTTFCRVPNMLVSDQLGYIPKGTIFLTLGYDQDSHGNKFVHALLPDGRVGFLLATMIEEL